MKISIFQIDTGRRSDDWNRVSQVHQPRAGFNLHFGQVDCEGSAELTRDEAARLIALLDEIEGRLERQAQSESSASVAAQEMRAMTSGGWDAVENVNAAIREMRGSDEASA